MATTSPPETKALAFKLGSQRWPDGSFLSWSISANPYANASKEQSGTLNHKKSLRQTPRRILEQGGFAYNGGSWTDDLAGKGRGRRNAIIDGHATEPLTIWCPILEPDDVVRVVIPAPVTVWSLFTALNEFYLQPLTEYDYTKIKDREEFDEEADQEYRDENKTYYDVRGNHVYLDDISYLPSDVKHRNLGPFGIFTSWRDDDVKYMNTKQTKVELVEEKAAVFELEMLKRKNGVVEQVQIIQKQMGEIRGVTKEVSGWVLEFGS